MTKQVKIIIAVIAVVVIAGAVAAYLLTRPNNPVANTNNANTNQNTNTGTNTNTLPPVSNTNTGTNVNTNENTNTGTETPQDERAEVLRLARIFIERYGTYSNRNNFENITSLEPFMTNQFQKESADYIAKNQKSGIEEAYYGITTTVAALQLSTFESPNATVTVSTRRVETRDTQDPQVFNQDVDVRFQLVDGNWKIGGVQWK